MSAKVCLVHDWLFGMRGGEKVLEALCELYPNAPIYTLFYDRKALSERLQGHKLHASFLQFVPGIKKIYRWLLPLYPLAVQSLCLKGFDVIISSSHCVAKGIRVPKNVKHICYCHSPMRYLWDMKEAYFGGWPRPVQMLLNLFFKWLRQWDVESSKGVDLFIANSNNIAKKIERVYGKKALVIYPPVDIEKGLAHQESQVEQPYYLMVSALVPYKRVDLAIKVFNRLKKRLIIVGDGPLMKALRELADPDFVQLKGWVDSEQLSQFYASAKALLYPGEEDFGIVSVEAQSYGTPVIAYGRGGTLETVIGVEGANESMEATGAFFYEQTEEAFILAVDSFEKLRFDRNCIRKNAKRFEKNRFKREFTEGMADTH